LNFEKNGFNENDLYNNSNIESLKRSKEYAGAVCLFDLEESSTWKGSISFEIQKNPYSKESSINNLPSNNKIKNAIKTKNK